MSYTNGIKDHQLSQLSQAQGVDLSKQNRSLDHIGKTLDKLSYKTLLVLQALSQNEGLTVEQVTKIIGSGVTSNSRRLRRLWGDPRLDNSLSSEDILLGRRPLKGVVTGAKQNANEYFLLPDVKPELIEQAIAQYKSDQSKEEDEDDDLEPTPNSEEVIDYELISKLKDKLAVTKKQADEYHAEASRLEAEAVRLYSLAKSMEETIEGLTKVGN